MICVTEAAHCPQHIIHMGGGTHPSSSIDGRTGSAPGPPADVQSMFDFHRVISTHQRTVGFHYPSVVKK